MLRERGSPHVPVLVLVTLHVALHNRQKQKMTRRILKRGVGIAESCGSRLTPSPCSIMFPVLHCPIRKKMMPKSLDSGRKLWMARLGQEDFQKKKNVS